MSEITTTIKSKVNKPTHESRDKADLTEFMRAVWLFLEAKYKEIYPLSKPPILTYTYRSFEAQTELYALGRTKKGSIVTHAKAGQSPHNYFPAFAFDVAFISKASPKKLDWSESNFKKLADIIEGSQYKDSVTWGGSWSGNKKDMPHFEQKDWKALSHAS